MVKSFHKFSCRLFIYLLVIAPIKLHAQDFKVQEISYKIISPSEVTVCSGAKEDKAVRHKSHLYIVKDLNIMKTRIGLL